MLFMGCGGSIKPPVPVDSGGAGASGAGDGTDGGASDGTGTDGAGADGAGTDGAGADGGSGAAGSVTVEATFTWRWAGGEAEACALSLTAADVPADWATWGARTDLNPPLDEPLPAELPDPWPASAALGDGVEAGHGSWRFSLSAETDPDFPAYAGAAADPDARLVCALLRGAGARAEAAVEHRPPPAAPAGPLEEVELRLIVLWDGG